MEVFQKLKFLKNLQVTKYPEIRKYPGFYLVLQKINFCSSDEQVKYE